MSMGCLTRVGCLAVIVAAGAGAYWLYGDQLPGELGRVAGRSTGAGAVADSRPVRATDAAIRWVSLNEATAGGAEAIARLGRRNGPQFVTLQAGDLAGFMAAALARGLPRSSVDPQVALTGDRVYLRAEVDLRDFAGQGAFGSVIGAAMNGRDTLWLAGTLDAIRPGLAQYRVRELRLKGINVPPRVIPSLVGTLRGRLRVDSLAPDGLPIPMPSFVSDVRVSDGKVTLYRTPR
ncbi:MAG: hypothetical protein V4617_11135 [Gemmatimonadota bacterium]